MRRRRFVVLGTVLLAGCGGDGGGDSTDTPDDSNDESDDSVTPAGDDGESDTPTPEGIENQTGNDANVGGSGNFDASVTFNSCNTVTIESDDSYTAVALSLAGGGSEMHDDGYSESTTFEADTTIQDVVIWGENGGKDNKVNPDLDACPQ